MRCSRRPYQPCSIDAAELAHTHGRGHQRSSSWRPSGLRPANMISGMSAPSRSIGPLEVAGAANASMPPVNLLVGSPTGSGTSAGRMGGSFGSVSVVVGTAHWSAGGDGRAREASLSS